MRPFVYLTLVFSAVLACNTSPEEKEDDNSTSVASVEPLQNSETTEMVNELNNIVTLGDPKKIYYWNHQRAELHKAELATVEAGRYNQVFYSYCQELLYAGETRQCITEIEAFLNQDQKPYSEIITNDNYVLFELLALAYLRLGEQENCQNAHTPYSCILPLQDPALHQLKEGSQKAIETYEIIQNHFPQEKYRWLINLAYMTLGRYPQDVPKKYSLNFPNWKLEQKNFPRFNEIAGNVGLAENGLSGGTCIEDFNNDGLLDVFITSSNPKDQAKLFFNNGKGSFDEVTNKAGLKGILGGLNCIHADYNNDGFVDILVLRGGWLNQNGKHPNSLLKNNGNGTFSDVTRSSGLLSYHPTQTAAWADFDKDGFLDLFIGNESENSDEPCELFHNNGNGTFTEVANKHGLGGITRFVKGVCWGDLNNDGWPDLYISNVQGPNLLFKNVNGNFEDITEKAGVQNPLQSFPCWFWDANNDGYQDLFVCSYDISDLFDLAGDYAREMQGLPTTREKSRLFINNGDETFTDQTEQYGISKSMYGMGGNFGDLDYDGYLDFYIGTGSPEYSGIIPNRMFRNKNGKTFEEVTSAGGFGHIQKGHGIAFGDLDQDGDQDIYGVMGGVYEGDKFTNILFENPGFGNNWIVIELHGTKTNKAAIGTRLELILDDDRKIYRTVGTGGSFGAHSLRQEIGLGKAKKIKTLTIFWQNSSPQVITDIDANQKIKITETVELYQKADFTPIPFSTTGTHVHQH